jgi:hypothetical protein
MLNKFRRGMRDIEDARGVALNRVMSAANAAAQSAKEASDELEAWTKDGLDSMKARPVMWGAAASLGMGALVGGLFTLWRKPKRAQVKTMAARSRAKQALRTASKTSAGRAKTSSKRAKKTRSRAGEPQAPENA